MKFVVQVEGRIVIEAEDAATAKRVAEGVLGQKLPWLKPSYSEPSRVADEEEVRSSLEVLLP